MLARAGRSPVRASESSQALYPNIQLQLIADPRLLDLRAARIDLAIRFGPETYPGYAVTKLMPGHVFPVCSPRLLAQHGPVDTLEALLDLPLLHDSVTEGDGSGSDWRSWLKHVGRHDAPCDKGQRFSGAGLLIDAAVLGLGVALVRASLVSDHVANGTLICPLGPAAPTGFAYYLLCLPEVEAFQRIACFRDWLRAEAARFTKTCRAQCKSAPCPRPRSQRPLIVTNDQSSCAILLPQCSGRATQRSTFQGRSTQG
jgi:LysR family transcriptional regulator, glycine cleavage system transcriptional activator